MPVLVESAGWPAAFAALSIGPFLGTLAMLRRRASSRAGAGNGIAGRPCGAGEAWRIDRRNRNISGCPNFAIMLSGCAAEWYN